MFSLEDVMAITNSDERDQDANVKARGRETLLRRISVELPLVLFALLVPPLVVPIGVGPGIRRDLLVAGCQVALSVVLVLAVGRRPSRTGTFATILGVMVVVGTYWAVVRGEVGAGPLGLIIVPAMLWVIWTGVLLKCLLESRNAPWAENIVEHAKRTYRIFVLLVCLAVAESLLVLHPRSGEPSTELYAMLLVTVVAALIFYVQLRLALLEKALSKTLSESSNERRPDGQAAAREEGADPEGASGHPEED